MHQTKKGNQWYFGMKAHFGVDSRTKLIHAVVAAPANVADSTVLPDLLQADQHHRLAAPVVGYRREREPPMHSMRVGPTAIQRMSVSVRCSGSLANTSSEPVIARS